MQGAIVRDFGVLQWDWPSWNLRGLSKIQPLQRQLQYFVSVRDMVCVFVFFFDTNDQRNEC